MRGVIFRVRRRPDGYALCAPMIHSPAPPPWQPGYTVAWCLEHDHAAAPGCRCGIYAAIEGTLDSLPGYLLDTAYDGDPWTYAEVACSGRVSWTRAVCAARRPSSCRSSLPRGPSQAQTSGCARPRILRRYGVRVGSSDAAPGWLTATSRGRGEPFPTESVDLSVLLKTLDRSGRRAEHDSEA
jgi:hypothetical protein